MNIEKRPIEIWDLGNGNRDGRIELDKCAIPETVGVTLCGEPLIPDSFVSFGHPIFTEEQVFIFKCLEYGMTRIGCELKADVIYEERLFTRKDFDIVAGIRNSLSNLKDFKKMLDDRRSFSKFKKERLNEFLVFGCVKLDEFGEIGYLSSEDRGKLQIRCDVESMESIWKRNTKKSVSFKMGRYVIPREGKCPCCGKSFTIEDIKEHPMVRRNSKIYHEGCWEIYRRMQETYNFTGRMVGRLYKGMDYWCKLIPNEYWGGRRHCSVVLIPYY